MAQVQIEGGPTYGVTEGDTLLRAALRAGVGFPHECNVGGCGACKYDLLSGEVQTLWEAAPGLSARDRRKGTRLACQSVPLGEVVVRTRLANECVPVHAPRVRAARLVRRMPITHDITEFTFHAEGAAQFEPGQYALLSLPGVTGVRAYSMSNLPNEAGLWQFMVRRVPGGQGSDVLFDALQVGRDVGLDGPYGMAYLRQPLARDVLCIAGGSGLAPMLSIARAAAPLLEAAQRQLHFFYGGRSEDDLLSDDLLRELRDMGDRVRCQQVLSAPNQPPAGSVAQGFVHAVAEAQLGAALPSLEIYFAGPPAMAEAVQDMLMVRYQVPFQQIHFDRFC